MSRPTRFSHSRLGTFESCPKKYEYAYVLGLEAPSESVEAFLGSRVHEALEKLYRDASMTRLLEEGELTAFFHRRWDESRHEKVQVVKPELDEAHYRAVGVREFETYYRRYHPFQGGTSVLLEGRMDFTLDPEGRYLFTGVVDRLTRRPDGVWELHDYKTSTTLPTRAELEKERQLSLYQLAVEQLYPEARDMELVYHYLFFDQELRLRRTREDLEKVARETSRAIDELGRTTEFLPRPSALCDWCEYKSLRPAWTLEREVGAAPDGNALAELVERYVTATETLKRLEAEKAELERALLRQAKERKLGTLPGRRHRLTVWRYRGVSLPGEGDPKRAELERRLKEAGLWDRVAPLSSYLLSKALGEGTLARDFTESLEGLISYTDGAKLYTKRM